MRLVAAWPPPARAFVTGVLAAMLPCGWLWAFVVTAAGTGSGAGGVLVMAVFWAGTLPMLVGIGLLVETVAGPLRRHLPAAAAVAMIVVGLAAVAGRGRPLDLSAAPAPGTSIQAIHGGHTHR